MATASSSGLKSSSSSSNPSQDSQHDNPMQDWTEKEKYCFIKSLKLHGPEEINSIAEDVSTRNFEEIKAAIEYCIRRATRLRNKTSDKRAQRSRRSKKPHMPLVDWGKLLTDNLSYNELRTETPTALRLIADLERIPSPECTDGIDFRNVYRQLANAMDGKPLNADLGTAAILHKCLIETALSSKAFIKTAALRNIITNIDLSEKEINMFPRPTEDHELAIIRHLASQRSYNPLKVPEDYLKPSTIFDDKKPKI